MRQNLANVFHRGVDLLRLLLQIQHMVAVRVAVLVSGALPLAVNEVLKFIFFVSRQRL